MIVLLNGSGSSFSNKEIYGEYKSFNLFMVQPEFLMEVLESNLE
jgi:hypothetical protein